MCTMIHQETPCPFLTQEDVEVFAAQLGLIVKRFDLKKPIGCRHWHFSKPGLSGTLELTSLPNGVAIWEARRNRYAAWQSQVVGQFDFLSQGPSADTGNKSMIETLVSEEIPCDSGPNETDSVSA